MHFAVANQNLRLVKSLEEFGADGTVKNKDGICPIDISITEDIKDVKMYFMSLSRYK